MNECSVVVVVLCLPLLFRHLLRFLCSPYNPHSSCTIFQVRNPWHRFRRRWEIRRSMRRVLLLAKLRSSAAPRYDARRSAGLLCHARRLPPRAPSLPSKNYLPALYSRGCPQASPLRNCLREAAAPARRSRPLRSRKGWNGVVKWGGGDISVGSGT